ncbi:MAG: hypothetical protein VW683_01305 [Betaproteobacteria bacterium]|jgi:hypothetical protein
MTYNGYTDHAKYLLPKIQERGVKTFLEFGLGDGTQHYLNAGLQVESVELSFDERSDWYDKCVERYSGSPNWNGTFVQIPESLRVMENNIRTDKNSDKIPHRKVDQQLLIFKDQPWFDDWSAMLAPWSETTWDCVFVDPGIHLRSELAVYFSTRAKMVAVHDIGNGHKMYGWDTVLEEMNRKWGKNTEGSIGYWYMEK